MTDRTAEERAQPRVSIIIPCLNGERYLAESLESALAQTHGAVEVVFIDDGSADGSLAIARGFPQVTVLSQPNAGISVARNAGMDASESEFVLFLDADDRLAPDAVRNHLAGFAAAPDAAMVYGAARIIDVAGETIEQQPASTGYMRREEMLVGVTPIPSQCMYRRDAVTAAGRFTPGLRMVEDYDLQLRIVGDAGLYGHGRVVCDYRRHPEQETSRLAENLARILETVDKYLPDVPDPAKRAALRREARDTWIGFYGQYIPFEVAKSLRAGRWKRAAYATGVYLRFLPGTAAATLRLAASRLGRR
jgi:glycosyltransferase involved in cell wall biosynthesis